MRIAFVAIGGVAWGGSEVLWVATAKEALQKGHEVLVSVFDWQPQHPNIKELEKSGAKFVYRRIFYPSFLRRLKKKIVNITRNKNNQTTYHDYLKKFRPDIILFNVAGSEEIAQDGEDMMVFIKQTSIPFVVFYHSNTQEPTKSHFVSQNFIFLLDKAKKNLFTAKMQVDLLEHFLAHQISNWQIINHPLKLSKKGSVPYPDDAIVQFAIIGNLIYRWKAQDMVLKIFGKEDWKKRDWVLNLYGKGVDKENIIQLAKHYGIEERIIFHGYELDIDNIWSKNHILLVPSRKDSGPIVFFEAMMMARPVVGSYMGAMPDYIIDNQTGILAKGTSEKDFEEALERAWNSKAEWEQWGIAAKKQMEAKYDFHPESTLLDILIN